MYRITPYTRKQARRLGVTVRQSTDRAKKIDVFKQGSKVASVGAAGMSDYPTYRRTRGDKYARTRRKLYKMRHERDRHVVGSPGFYADQLLW
jgi:hypothetical protein